MADADDYLAGLDPIPLSWMRPAGHVTSSGHDRGFEGGRVVGRHEARTATRDDGEGGS